jgi:anti-sigma factor ChrR (cupin superfamily)
MSTTLNIFEDSGWSDATGIMSGFKQKILHDENGMTTLLLKCPAGSTIPANSHPFVEENIILKGSFLQEGKVIPAGTFQRYEPGEVHGPFECREEVLGIIRYYPR